MARTKQVARRNGGSQPRRRRAVAPKTPNQPSSSVSTNPGISVPDMNDIARVCRLAGIAPHADPNDDWGDSDAEHATNLDDADIVDVANEQCFGFMRGEIVGLRYYTGHVSRGEMVRLEREPQNKYDSNAIRVENSLGEQIGHIKREHAMALASIMDKQMARVEGRCPTNKNTFSMGVDLAFYGREEKAQMVRDALAKHGYELSDHKMASGSGMGEKRTDDAALSEFANYSSATKTLTNEELNKELDKVFENLRDEDKLLHEEPSKLISTKLFLHQKQALAWMMKREKGDELPPFWNEEKPNKKRRYFRNTLTGILTDRQPDALCGGILADDMGLGKTLEVISLIATNGADSKPVKLRRHAPTSNTSSTTTSYRHQKKRKRVSVLAGQRTQIASPRPSAGCEKVLQKLREAKSKSGVVAATGASGDAGNTQSPAETSKDDGQLRNNSVTSDTDCSDIESGQGQMKAEKSKSVPGETASSKSRKRPRHVNRIGSDSEDSDDEFLTQNSSFTRDDENAVAESKKEEIAEESFTLDDPGFSDLAPSAGEKDFEFESPDDIVEGPRATLIICPMSVMQNWEDQIEQHIDPRALPYISVHRQYGNRMLSAEQLKKMDVVITTYQTMSSAHKRKKDPLFEVEWLRIVLDEAHFIRNPLSQMAKAACDLKARRRWALTGTPIQNRLLDLWSIIKFLRVKPLEQRFFWRQCIERPITQRSEIGFKCIRALMKATAMRRTKTQEIEPGKPLVNLPPRIMRQETVEFSEDERALYDAMLKEGRLAVNRYIQEGTILHHMANVLAILMRLRQLCCHPYLVRKAAQRAKEAGLLMMSIAGIAQRNEEENRHLAQTLLNLIESEEGNGCPICFDNPPIRPVMNPICKHYYCRECINEWIRTRPDGRCPMCRGPLDPTRFVEKPKDAPEETKENNSAKEDAWHTSVKVDAVMTNLLRLRKEDPSIKSIVISQFTSFLDVIEKPLIQENFKFVRLDGTMDAQERKEAVRTFQMKSPGTPTIFLLSLKAGGVGINLTAATRVFLMDPAWNPACEEQCFDRCHRLGQTKEVTIVKFIVKESIEERMLDLQERKRMLMVEAFGGGKKRDIKEFITMVRGLLS